MFVPGTHLKTFNVLVPVPPVDTVVQGPPGPLVVLDIFGNEALEIPRPFILLSLKAAPDVNVPVTLKAVPVHDEPPFNV